MKKLRHIMLLAVLLLSGASQAFAAQARPDNTRRAPIVMPDVRVSQVQPARSQFSRVQYAQQRISAAQAKAAARRHVPGAQVVGISLEGSAYRVRMVRSDGRRVDVFVDAVTGRVR
mgnify:CR=1 FL=1